MFNHRIEAHALCAVRTKYAVGALYRRPATEPKPTSTREAVVSVRRKQSDAACGAAEDQPRVFLRDRHGDERDLAESHRARHLDAGVRRAPRVRAGERLAGHRALRRRRLVSASS